MEMEYFIVMVEVFQFGLESKNGKQEGKLPSCFKYLYTKKVKLS